jgi:ribosomal protein S8
MDNLANSFSKIQNSQIRRKQTVFLNYSKIVWNICTVLFVEGFIQGFERGEKGILIFLKYSHDKPVIEKISKISLQGRRVYTKKMSKSESKLNTSQETNKIMNSNKDSSRAIEFQQIQNLSKNSNQMWSKGTFSTAEGNLKSVQRGLGIKILSTSKGILSERDARFFGIGGEILCEVF